MCFEIGELLPLENPVLGCKGTRGSQCRWVLLPSIAQAGTSLPARTALQRGAKGRIHVRVYFHQALLTGG